MPKVSHVPAMAEFSLQRGRPAASACNGRFTWTVCMQRSVNWLVSSITACNAVADGSNTYWRRFNANQYSHDKQDAARA